MPRMSFYRERLTAKQRVVEQKKIDAALAAAYSQWGSSLERKGGLGYGTTRAVFKVSEGMVLKIPRYPNTCNRSEAWIAANGGAEISPEHCAPCVLIDFMGVECLLMDKVVPVDFVAADCGKIELPDWVYNLDDGPQVGHLKDGRLVAYDFA